MKQGMSEKQTIISVDFGADESSTAVCVIEYDPDSKQRRVVDVRQGNDAIEYLRNNAPKIVYEWESNGQKPNDLVLHPDEPNAVDIDEAVNAMAEAERKAMTRIERDFVVVDDDVPAPDEKQFDMTPNRRKRLAQKARARRKKQPGKRRH